MTWHVGVSGSYKQVATPSVGVGGAWKSVQSAWVGVGGVWKKFFDAINGAISDQYVTGTSSASYRLKNDGIGQTGANGVFSDIPGEWLLAGAASDLEIRAFNLTGDTGFVTGTFNSFLNLGTTRTWQITASGGTFRTCTFELELRRVADGVTVDTATITLEADNT